MTGKQGFTMIELCVVMAIIAVAVSIAIPNMIGRRADSHFTAAMRQAVSIMNHSRVVALKENTRIVVVFDTHENTYRSFVDISNDRAWNPAVDRQIAFYALPQGVDINTSTFPAVPQVSGAHYCSYNTRGYPDQTGRITLSGRKDRTVQIFLSRTGRIRVE